MWDSRWRWLAGAGLVLLAAALVSIWRSHRHSRQAKVIWTVVAVLLPILGPLGWFVLARETRRH